ncbi:MAG: phosphate starvation-inducible protein PhoH, partial [Flavobacteriaceae bacterium]
MNEIKIELSEVNPREFFGQQNVHIDQIKSYFPKLKIVARGSTLKAYGEERLLDEFDKRIEMLQAHFGKYNVLDKETIDRVIQANSAEEYDPALEMESFILHG